MHNKVSSLDNWRRSLRLYFPLVTFCFTIFLISCTDVFETSTIPLSIAQAGATATTTTLKETDQAQLVRVKQIMQGMTLDQKLGQLIVVEYFGNAQGYSYQNTELPTMISQQFVGGILFQEVNHNFTPPYNTVSGFKGLTNQIMHDARIPLLLTIDQEGGQVAKLSSFFGAAPSARQMALSGDPQTALTQGQQNAQWISQVGLNGDLAPVVDVGPINHLLEDRQFSDNPQTVATYAGAFLNGLQQNGVIGCLKHFPGLGSLPKGQDPHFVLPRVTSSRADLENIDLAPYKQIIQQQQPAMIMTTNVVTQALDPALPAELSAKAINVLRKDLGFNGVIITDGLYMLKNFWSLNDAAVMSIAAGNDMIEGPYTSVQVAGVITALKQALQNGRVSQSQIDQAVQHILLMKLHYKLLK